MSGILYRKPATIALVSCVLVAATAGLGLSVLQASDTDLSQPSDGGQDAGQDAVAHMLQRYCFQCHGADTQEANIRFDTLDLSLSKPSDAELVQHIADVLKNGEMPPEDADGPSADQRELVAMWATRQLSRVAAEARRSGGWTRNRRLTVAEYNFTMQSLFAVDADFADHLPPDPVSQAGFQNDSELLGISSLLMECYLDSARRAVQRYVRSGQTDEPPLRYHIQFQDLYYTTADRYKTRQRAPKPLDLKTFETRSAECLGSPPRYVEPLSPIPPGPFPTDEGLRAALPKLHEQFIALPQSTSQGEMVVRIRAAATPDRSGRYPRMRVHAGTTLGDGDSMDTRLLGEIDVTAPPEKPAVYEFRIRMEDVPSKGTLRDEDAFDKLSVFDMVQVFIANVSRDDQAIYALGRGSLNDAQAASTRVTAPLKKMADAGVNFLYLDSAEIEMLPSLTATGPYRWSVELAQTSPEEQRATASEFLQRFMRQAYRRPVSPAEVAQKMELFDTLRNGGDGTEQSLRETLAAVLVSPSFLFLDGYAPDPAKRSPELTAHRLASRLSYLLWLAPPDEQLIQLADSGALLDRNVLANEAERLLDDPRSRRFLDSFCRQWLRLDKFPHVAVDAKTYPGYDSDLAEATLQETLQTFAELFRSDASMLKLLDADYAFLNDRLAAHYGLEPVLSGDLQKVPLPPAAVRGGLLTQASVLTMNSDGVDSHPIRRGVWLLERLLNAPPPPPPPNVPELDEEDPDFRGLSLKERIERHRKPGACQSCHKKIDPWGIALENFDATGRWRDGVPAGDQRGRSLRRSEDPEVLSTPVDASVQLPSGQPVNGIHDLKRHLRQHHSEDFTRALVHHLLTYASGRPLDFADRQDVEAVHQRFAAAEFRPRELLRAIVQSEAFGQ